MRRAAPRPRAAPKPRVASKPRVAPKPRVASKPRAAPRPRVAPKPRVASKPRAAPKPRAAIRKKPSSPKKAKRTFVSFDYDKDKNKKNLLVGQSRNKRTPFKISDHSLKEAAPDKKWEDKARSKIKRSDKVIVLLGKQTHRAPGVKKEIKIARQEKKPIIQITTDPKNKSVPKAGKRRKWNWDNLRKELE